MGLIVEAELIRPNYDGTRDYEPYDPPQYAFLDEDRRESLTPVPHDKIERFYVWRTISGDTIHIRLTEHQEDWLLPGQPVELRGAFRAVLWAHLEPPKIQV